MFGVLPRNVRTFACKASCSTPVTMKFAVHIGFVEKEGLDTSMEDTFTCKRVKVHLVELLTDPCTLQHVRPFMDPHQ